MMPTIIRNMIICGHSVGVLLHSDPLIFLPMRFGLLMEQWMQPTYVIVPLQVTGSAWKIIVLTTKLLQNSETPLHCIIPMERCYAAILFAGGSMCRIINSFSMIPLMKLI